MTIIQAAVLGITGGGPGGPAKAPAPGIFGVPDPGGRSGHWLFKYFQAGADPGHSAAIGSQIRVKNIYLGTLLKMVGITYIAEFASGICRDAGFSALGTQVEMFGKLSILAVSAPVLQALLETLQVFLS